ncbi:MAG: valine--pyruvate transaminase [Lentisphaeraceae bacterium]|nr:valine--pyruvate transaminase [Lentisphaeraceae bacterium]
MKLSKFGKKFSRHSGIVQLMDDLGSAMAENDEMLMLGGGNPSHIKEIQDLFQHQLQDIVDDRPRLDALLGNYDGPAGEINFRKGLADLFKEQFAWDITAENICLTNGSQSGFFTLMNMFGGENEDGSKSKILLPLIPEYIGYTDQGLSEEFFVTVRPKIEMLDDHTFKYRVDFDSLEITDDIAAICVSRPTNPTGNVMTDDEIEQLAILAQKHDIPLIIDNAYGLPFPDIIFVDAKPLWHENIILCMSLSKLGLPGVRTGIVVASDKIVKAIGDINSILSLSPGSWGANIAKGLLEDGEIIRMSHEVIRPYYHSKALKALEVIKREFDGLDYAVHKPEGALFLWVWFKDLPISSYELYERLKKKNVLIVSGHYFFFDQVEDWDHSQKCIRMTYSMDESVVEEAITIMAKELKALQGK